MGRRRYPEAKRLTTTADGAGSGSRVRPWKRELQALANELGIEITAHRLPPGTSKWNKLEHHWLPLITQNGRGRPLVSYLTIVQLIDANTYPKGVEVDDDERAALNIHRYEFRGEWNYTIKPTPLN